MNGIKGVINLMDYTLENYKKINWRFEEVEKGGDLIRVTIKDSDGGGGKSVRYVSRNDLEGIVGVMKIVLENA